MTKLREGALALLEYAAMLAAWPGRAREPGRLSPARILVIAYSRIGDLIFLLPALEAVRKEWPEAKITFVANRYPSHLELLPAFGLVDELWLYELEELERWRTRREITARIRAGSFDVAIVGQASKPRAFGAGLLSVPVRVGHCVRVEPAAAGWSAPRLWLWRLRRAFGRQELERRLVLNRKVWLAGDGAHAVERNLALARALGIETKPAAQAKPRLALPEEARVKARARLADAPGRLTLGLHLGSAATTGYAKLWPAERWAETLEIVRAGTPMRVALFGGPGEEDSVAVFRRGFGGEVLDFVATPRLLETFALIERCGLFLSSDTGLSKAAMALGVPTVAVWGPVERSGYGKIWDPERHFEVYREMPCAPCVRFGLPLEGPGVINYTNCGHHDCLARLEPASVAEAVRRAAKIELPEEKR